LIAAERERCAKVCEDMSEQADESWEVYADQGAQSGLEKCAAAIRALD
jgi:hypothetical protein